MKFFTYGFSSTATLHSLLIPDSDYDINSPIHFPVLVLYEDVIPYTPAPLLQELGLKNKIHTRESRKDMHT